MGVRRERRSQKRSPGAAQTRHDAPRRHGIRQQAQHWRRSAAAEIQARAIAAENALGRYEERPPAMTAPAPTELLPCPFCGGPATLGGLPNGIIGYVRCRNDNCFGPKTTAVTKRDSIIQWNTRQAASVERAEGKCNFPNCECSPATPCPKYAHSPAKTVERAEVVVGGVDVLGLADCFEADELRGRSPIREFNAPERRIVAAALRALASPPRPEGVRASEVQTTDLKWTDWEEGSVYSD